MPHRLYLQDAIADAEDGRGPADIVITCPPDGGDGSDVENIDDENLQNSAMPNEVAGQLETIHYTEVMKFQNHHLLVLRREN